MCMCVCVCVCVSHTYIDNPDKTNFTHLLNYSVYKKGPKLRLQLATILSIDCSVMAKVLDSEIVVSEFELKSYYYTFGMILLGKV